MFIMCHEKISLPGYSTVYKFIVVRVIMDQFPMVIR